MTVDRSSATSESIHSCSYYCEQPACVRRQRDELRDQSFLSEKLEQTRDRNMEGAEDFVTAIILGESVWPNAWGQDVALAAYTVERLKNAAPQASANHRAHEAVSGSESRGTPAGAAPSSALSAEALRKAEAIHGKTIAFPIKLRTDSETDPGIEWFEDANGDRVDPYTAMLALNAAYCVPSATAATTELLHEALAALERHHHTTDLMRKIVCDKIRAVLVASDSGKVDK